MAKITDSRQLQGRRDTELDWPSIESFFNTCFGKDKQGLPKYPAAIGSIFARWQEQTGARHEAESLGELQDAYQRRVTYQVEFGSILPDPPENLSFIYRPGAGHASLDVTTSSRHVIDSLSSRFKDLFPLPLGCVFISYETREVRLAEFLKKLLEARLGSGVPVFVAKGDIRVGDDPTRKMIRENLLHANAIVSICTPFSKMSPWLYWETASVWARDQLVVPLFAAITPEEFKGPIQVLLQGRQLFDRSELVDGICEIGKRIVPSLRLNDLTDDEAREYDELSHWHRAMHSEASLS
jgi:hypothetical protein